MSTRSGPFGLTPAKAPSASSISASTATDLFLNGKSDEPIERMARMNPLERLGTPADIASVVAFLAGPDGAWINGQTLRANGGVI